MTDYGSIDGKTCEWLHRKWMRSQSDNTDFCDYDDTGGIMRGSVHQTFHHVDPKSEARWLIDWNGGHWRLSRITGFGEDWKREQIASIPSVCPELTRAGMISLEQTVSQYSRTEPAAWGECLYCQTRTRYTKRIHYAEIFELGEHFVCGDCQ